MSRVVIKEESLKNVADQVRLKTGTSELYTVDEMAEAISNIKLIEPELEELNITENGEYTPTKYGYSKVTANVQPELEELSVTENGEYLPTKYGYSKVTVNTPTVPAEALTISGSMAYRFTDDSWSWFIKEYGDKVTTKDITSLLYAFSDSEDIMEIPFTLNVTNCSTLSKCFYMTQYLRVCPKIRGTLSNAVNLESAIRYNTHLRTVEDLFEPSMLDGFAAFKFTGAFTGPRAIMFADLWSLRKIPTWWYKFKLNPESSVYPYSSYMLYANMLVRCYSLDEVTDIPVWTINGKTLSSNTFSQTADSASRLQHFTFETNDGQPITANWASQTIDLSKYVGYVQTAYIDNVVLNSGITMDKRVVDDASYQALKNDPDWFTTDIIYSRYNHDSAVETINSLPDCSASGQNTVKFKGESGANTDGGAINTLTAEEIAVATAKGWTVTLV